MYTIIWQDSRGARFSTQVRHREDALLLALIAAESFPHVHVRDPAGQGLLPFLWSC